MTLGTFDKVTFMGAVSAVRHDWTRSEIRDLFALPFPELMFQAPVGAPRQFRSGRGPGLDAAVDQDRRLPGGLRLLPAERQLRHRRQGREADEPRQGSGRGAGREGCRREPLLHGRRLARAQGPRPRQGLRDDRGRARDGARDLRHARHAEQCAGEAAERIRASITTTTISTPRRNSMARSSPRAPIRSGSTRSIMCATPASMSAAAASSAWARALRIASA